MGANQSIQSLDSSSFVCTALRKLIEGLAAVAVAATIAASVNLRAQESNRIPRIYMPPDLPAPAPPAVPTAQYVPSGYVLLGAYSGEPDGFGTGKAEIKFAYLNPKLVGRTFSPLLVFVSPMTDNRFDGFVDHAPERVILRIGNVNIEGRYFDGSWVASPTGERIAANGKRLRWDTSNLNALVFPFEGFMIGILGSKQGGVGRSELIRIAKSLTYTAR